MDALARKSTAKPSWTWRNTCLTFLVAVLLLGVIRFYLFDQGSECNCISSNALKDATSTTDEQRPPTSDPAPSNPATTFVTNFVPAGARTFSVIPANIFPPIDSDHPFRNISTPKERQEILERARWTSETWSRELDSIFKANTLETGWIIVAFVNKGMLELTMNFLASLERQGYKKFVLLSFDVYAYVFLCDYGYIKNAGIIPRSWIHRDMPQDFVYFATDGWLDMMRAKLLILIELLNRKYSLLFTDVDLVFLSPHIVGYVDSLSAGKAIDLWTMVDNDGPIVDMNTGFYFIKPVWQMAHVFGRAFNLTYGNDKRLKLEQNAVNHIWNTEMKSYFYHSERIRRLDKILFPTGEFWFFKNLNQQLQVAPMVAHANYMAGTEPKKQSFKKFNMWYVGESFINQNLPQTLW